MWCSLYLSAKENGKVLTEIFQSHYHYTKQAIHGHRFWWNSPQTFERSQPRYIVGPLSTLFNRSSSLGQVPDEWKHGMVSPIYKGVRKDRRHSSSRFLAQPIDLMPDMRAGSWLGMWPGRDVAAYAKSVFSTQFSVTFTFLFSQHSRLLSSKNRELASQFSFLCMSSTVSGSNSWSFVIIGDHSFLSLPLPFPSSSSPFDLSFAL